MASTERELVTILALIAAISLLIGAMSGHGTFRVIIARGAVIAILVAVQMCQQFGGRLGTPSIR